MGRLAPDLTRERVRIETSCPHCGALRNEKCFRWSKDGKILLRSKINHKERVQAAWDSGKFRSPKYPMGYRNSDDYKQHVAEGREVLFP